MNNMDNITREIADFRDSFPAYKQGIYLNHGAVSPFSRITKDAFDEYWHQRSNLPVDIFESILKIKDDFLSNIAMMINGGGKENISLVPNTSYGINIVAQGIDVKSGDEIILPSIEFPSNVYPFMNLEEKGARIIWVKPDRGKITTDAIQAKITDKTRLISISYVQFLNGYKADLKELGRLCKKNNIIFCVDGIQGIGAIPVDVKECQVDAFVSGGHKWLMWPMGVGFIYTSCEFRKRLKVPVVGWLSVKNPWDILDFKLELKESGECLEPGNLNFLGMYIAHQILQRFLKIGIPNIYQRIIGLTDILIKGLLELKVPIISPLDLSDRSGIISARFQNSKELEGQLTKKKVFIAFREGIIRFSVHFTNTKDEMYEVIRIIKSLLI